MDLGIWGRSKLRPDSRCDPRPKCDECARVGGPAVPAKCFAPLLLLQVVLR